MCEDVKGRKKDPSLFGGTYMKNAMQLKAYVKNLAKDKKVSAQIVLQNYMLERLLERIPLLSSIFAIYSTVFLPIFLRFYCDLIDNCIYI